MEALTFDDLVQAGAEEVTSVQWRGKTVYVRDLAFDAAQELSSRFSGREQDEASSEDLKMILAAVLCDERGNALNTDTNEILMVLGRMNYKALLSLWEAVEPVVSIEPTDDAVKN